jgi:molybdate-binding protein/DNA-binding XRE family transcriptional regulator
MIMPSPKQHASRIKLRRLDRGWSQAELAQGAGISRAAVSAIEVDRLVPSVAAALSLARTLDCTVEELFGSESTKPVDVQWAWPPASAPCRYWQAQVGGRMLRFPVEGTAAGVIAHDGVHLRGSLAARSGASPEQTLVIACCDPAASILMTQYTRLTGFRLLALSRSSQQALTLLSQGLVHVAGIHLSSPDRAEGNAKAVRERLGSGFRLLRVARWQEGLALAPGVGVDSVSAALRSKLRWVGRESGSGARQCLDDLFGDRQVPRRLARDHRGVAEAVRCGWADAGVCLRLVSEEAGLHFLPVREESYDFCFPKASVSDPRLQALIRVLRNVEFRKLLGELPGYHTAQMGEEREVS